MEIKNLRGPIERIGMVQMLRYLRFNTALDKNYIRTASSVIPGNVGYHLAGAVYLPPCLDAMPSYPVFLCYDPFCWGRIEHFTRKRFFFDPKFIQAIQQMSEESFDRVEDEILKPVDQKKYNPNLPIFEILSD